MNNRNDPAGLGDLHIQMKITNKLLAAQLREKIQQKDLIRLLMTTGASDQEIADVLGTTSGTVAVTKQRLKKDAGARAAAKMAPGSGGDANA